MIKISTAFYCCIGLMAGSAIAYVMGFGNLPGVVGEIIDFCVMLVALLIVSEKNQ